MRTTLSAVFVVCAIFWAAGVRAEQAFVVEASKATPEIGAQVDSTTSLVIEGGGHIVIMTDTGRMIRRDGPYRGAAEPLFARQPALTGEPLSRTLILGLLDLAKESGRSEETAFGVRGKGGRPGFEEAGPYAIAPGTSVFCVHANVPPAFFTPDPPTAGGALVMRRVSRPKELLRADWPAGAQRMAWPPAWPPPAKGRYLVAIGEGGGWAVRLVPVGPRPAQALRQASVYYEAGCPRQAAAAMRLAVNGAVRR